MTSLSSMRPARIEKCMDPGQHLKWCQWVECYGKPTDVHPYTGASLSPVLDSQEKTNKSRDNAVPVESIKDCGYEHADARNQEVNFEHVVVTLTDLVTMIRLEL